VRVRRPHTGCLGDSIVISAYSAAPVLRPITRISRLGISNEQTPFYRPIGRMRFRRGDSDPKSCYGLQVFHARAHVIGEWGGEFDVFRGFGVDKSQDRGMQGLAFHDADRDSLVGVFQRGRVV
jgi:hypothetical protein